MIIQLRDETEKSHAVFLGSEGDDVFGISLAVYAIQINSDISLIYLSKLPFSNMNNEPGNEYFSDGLYGENLYALPVSIILARLPVMTIFLCHGRKWKIRGIKIANLILPIKNGGQYEKQILD